MSEPTVFIVDDDQAVARSLRWLIETVRLRVETYGSAQSFIDGYDPARPGCLVLDVRMPGMSGMDVLKAIKAQWPDCEVIIITGHPMLETAKESVTLGANDYLAKPVGPDDVINATNKALLNKRWALRCEPTASASRLH